MKWAEMRKAIIAVATMVVEIVAIWQGAPEWALVAAAVAGAVLVWGVPNRLPSSLPALSAAELSELAARAREREAAR